jgi:hypothetical protein
VKKIGLLCLALVLALGALGVGYASWTDTIFVTGTVNTGSVDLSIVELSSTYVYKVPGEEAGQYDDVADEMVVVHQRKNMRPSDGITWSVINVPPIPPNGILVASATANCTADDTISVTFDNAFPCTTLTADFLVHNVGSIPVKVDAEIISTWGDVALLGDPGVCGVHFYWWDEETGMGNEIIECPVQMHECEYVYCVMTLHLPQDDAYQGLEGGFTAQINAIQWNKYGVQD